MACSAPSPLYSIKRRLIKPPYHLGHGDALHAVSVVSPLLLLLGRTLGDIFDSMLYLELVLDFLLTPDVGESLYFPELQLSFSWAWLVIADGIGSSMVHSSAHSVSVSMGG